MDVTVTHAGPRTRVVIRGSAPLGRLLSLMQVLDVDSACWPHEAVLVDVSGLELPLAEPERARLQEQARRCLRRMKQVAFAWEP